MRIADSLANNTVPVSRYGIAKGGSYVLLSHFVRHTLASVCGVCGFDEVILYDACPDYKIDQPPST